MSWGFTTRTRVSAASAAATLSTHLDAVAVDQLLGPVGAALGDHEVIGADAGAQQPGQQRLPHDAGAEDGRRAAHRRLVRRRARNSARLAGFSAIRRTR